MEREMFKSGRVLFALAAVVLWMSTAQAVSLPFVDDAQTIGLYHLNESTGTTAYDDASVRGTANNATLVGNELPTWVPGLYGNGLHFNQPSLTTGGALQITHGAIGTWHVLEMTVKWDYAETGPYEGGDAGFLGYLFSDWSQDFCRVWADGSGGARLSYNFQCYGSPQWVGIDTPLEFSLQAGVWTHLAFVTDWRYDAPIPYDYAAIYVNGEIAAELIMIASDGHTRYPVSGGPLNIGSPSSLSFNGTIDEVRLTAGRRAESELGVPEPATMALLLIGGLAALRRRS
jgi:hypothetical protein